MTDTYRVAQAAAVLGRSERRVRQLIAEGRLTPLQQPGPVLIPQEQVHLLRTETGTRGDRTGSSAYIEQALQAAQQAAAAAEKSATAAQESQRRAIESSEKVEQALRDRLAETEATVRQQALQLEQLQQELQSAIAAAGKKWQKRKKKR